MILPAAVLALPWRLIGAVGLVAVVALMGWRVTRWHDAYAALPGLRDALAREEACEEGSQCAGRVAALVARQEQATREAIAVYEQELADIRNRPPVRRVIRVCPDPGDVRVPGTAAGTDGTAAPGGIISGPIEFDTQPIFDLAREADEVAARLRALQGWNQALSTQPKK